MIDKSLDAEVSHHFVVLMLENVAVEDVAGSSHIKGERLAVVVAELDSGNGHHASWHFDHIQELLLLCGWRKDSANHVGSHVDLRWYGAKSTAWHFAICCFPISLVFHIIKFESAYYLEVHQMNVDWMIIHGQVYDVEVVCLSLLENSSIASLF